MNAIAFDTLQFTKRLTRVGATPQLAQATAEAFKEASGQAQLATKRDIEQLEGKIDRNVERLEAKIDRLESRIDAGLANVGKGTGVELAEANGRMDIGFAELNNKIEVGFAEFKNDIIKWLVGLTFAQIALSLGILIKIS
uniref:DUF1640 domain-containing protein n=1 Tax=Candidatus Kentrum sp. LPFa TaxID=2126335 RepID=A0A450W4P2_9GAMM|nr:MAG: Protein of unknown function (DUF1640) [Candidatus Kentron sp. LPFa]VFK28012.1 MAG: Protein of unknown function (DUF1640) [Candidatus Kentron sp. LPFa]